MVLIVGFIVYNFSLSVCLVFGRPYVLCYYLLRFSYDYNKKKNVNNLFYFYPKLLKKIKRYLNEMEKRGGGSELTQGQLARGRVDPFPINCSQVLNTKTISQVHFKLTNAVTVVKQMHII